MENNKVKKILKPIAVFLLFMLFISTLASCAQSDVPDGYQLIACEGDKFRLYVPTQWVSNTTGGMTSAFYSMDRNTSVSVHVADDAGEMSVEEYWSFCNEKYASELKEYQPSDKYEKTVLGGQAAHKYVYSAKMSVYSEAEKSNVEQTYKFMQVIARYGGEMFVLLYTAPEQYYDEYLSEVEGDSSGAGIIPYFKFADPYVSEDGEKEFSNKVTAPNGMKLASTDERAYRFFVPQSWIINDRTEATAAYASETDSSNVSVQMYMTGDSTETVEKHWERLETSYKTMFSEYNLISDEEIKMDGVAARKYTYTVTSGGQEYKMLQAIVRKGDMFYCITYTALTENFDIHMTDVAKMIESFDIR